MHGAQAGSALERGSASLQHRRDVPTAGEEPAAVGGRLTLGLGRPAASTSASGDGRSLWLREEKDWNSSENKDVFGDEI